MLHLTWAEPTPGTLCDITKGWLWTGFLNSCSLHSNTLTVSAASACRTIVKTPTMISYIFTLAMYTSWASDAGVDFRWLHPVISVGSFVPKKKISTQILRYNWDFNISEILTCWWLSACSVNVSGRDGWGTSSFYKWRLSSPIQRISDYKSLTATRVWLHFALWKLWARPLCVF